ncbi:MAG: hypothetical protein GXP43_01010 [bacterium]|nr:hypothetical protein [bacterium]
MSLLRITLGLLISLITAYIILGTLVAFALLSPPRLFINHTYAGLLPYYWVEKIAAQQTPSNPRLTFRFKQTITAVPISQLGINISYPKALSNHLNNFTAQPFYKRWLAYHQFLFSNLNLTPVVTINQKQLVNRLARPFQNQWSPPQPAKLTYNKNKITLLPATDGYQIDEAVLIKDIRTALNHNLSEPIKIPLKFISLKPSPQQKQSALTKARKLIKTQIALTRNKTTVFLTKPEKVSLVSLYQDIDVKSLQNIAQRQKQTFDIKPQDALFRYQNGRVITFQPSKNGFLTDLGQLKKDLKQTFFQITNSPAPTKKISITITGKTIPPKITTHNSNDYGIKELVGQGESWFAHSIPNRIHNIALAASKINGILIAPGETFSFNKYLGEVSARTGYRQSYVIKQGKTILDDGGGVCQVSTTLFRAILNAGLPIIERHAHSYRVSYYEQKASPGLDATVFAPYVDLKFKNDLKSYILIQAETNKAKKHLVFKLYGTKDNRQVNMSKVRIWDQSPPPPPLYQDDPTLPPGTTKQIEWPAWGAKVAFSWTVTKNGQILYQKTFFSNYKPWRAVYLKN